MKKEIERIWSEGKVVVLDVDVVGGVNLKNHFGDTSLSIIVQPPSIEVLRKRLENRGTETTVDIDKRVNKATEELTYAPKFDTVLINDGLETAFLDGEELVRLFIV